jgi:hypothetical protein
MQKRNERRLEAKTPFLLVFLEILAQRIGSEGEERLFAKYVKNLMSWAISVAP